MIRRQALAGLGRSGAAVEEPGILGHRRAVESIVGLKKWTACQSLACRPPSRLKSGPTRRVPNITGRCSSFWYSSRLGDGSPALAPRWTRAGRTGCGSASSPRRRRSCARPQSLGAVSSSQLLALAAFSRAVPKGGCEAARDSVGQGPRTDTSGCRCLERLLDGLLGQIAIHEGRAPGAFDRNASGEETRARRSTGRPLSIPTW